VIALLYVFTNAVKVEDKITKLPGLNWQPNFDQYSGYITVDELNGRALFYWFVESQSDPTIDPIVVWFQGGPGCSSLLGFFTENGPFSINEDETLSPNPYSWNRIANVLYVESPAGVGYSYSNTTSDYVTGDNKTMEDAYTFLVNWFAAFPEFDSHHREFYLTGESYAGHYLPQLAWVISQHIHDVKLDGFLVGNAWSDDVIDSNSLIPFIYNHALCSLSTYEEVLAECNLTTRYGDLTPSIPFHDANVRVIRGSSGGCEGALNEMFTEVSDLINQYDIYTPCVSGTGLDCMNYTAILNYLNSDDVKEAIHAKMDLPWPWEVCTGNINYTESWTSVVPLYNELIQLYRVTVYSGDVTFNVPFQGSAVWIQNLNRPIVSPWQYWLVDGQVAGYITKYDLINFVTVKNAGHMVPQYQPHSAYRMFEKYLKGDF